MATVVVGYVPKPEGEAALTSAIQEARLRDATLIVVYSHRGGPGFDEASSAKADAQVEMIKQKINESGVAFEVRQLVRGFEPSEDLIHVAQEADAELIVIGLRRRTPVGKLILGSNAQRILLDAHCPVLAVKSD